MAGIKFSSLTQLASLVGTELIVSIRETGTTPPYEAVTIPVALLGGTPTKLAGINTQTGTAYTFVLADAGKDVRGSNSGAIAFTVPKDVFDVGAYIFFSAALAGMVTVSGASGVVVNGSNGYATTAQYQTRALLQVATNVWEVI